MTNIAVPARIVTKDQVKSAMREGLHQHDDAEPDQRDRGVLPRPAAEKARAVPLPLAGRG